MRTKVILDRLDATELYLIRLSHAPHGFEMPCYLSGQVSLPPMP